VAEPIATTAGVNRSQSRQDALVVRAGAVILF
jgi:hypothetical protein